MINNIKKGRKYMPNWCEGKLKIRGKRKDLINFIKKWITAVI